MTINIYGILAAGLLHFVIGSVWYSPLMFGDLWLRLTGVKELKPGLMDMILALVSSMIVAFVLAYVVVVLCGATNWLDGATCGVVVEVGFIATLLLGDVIFEKKPFKLFVLRNGYNLVALTLMGALLAVWR